MGDIEHRTVIFTVAVLYSMEEKWRGMDTSRSLEDILGGRRGVNLHRAWSKLLKEGLLGEFSKEFWYDSLYATSNLGDVLRKAHMQHLLIRLDGSNFGYHLDQVSPEVIERLLRWENIPSELVIRVSARLNVLLGKQEASVKPPIAS